jgi:hypothetical protein
VRVTVCLGNYDNFLRHKACWHVSHKVPGPLSTMRPDVDRLQPGPSSALLLLKTAAQV